MKVIALKAENFKRLVAVSIKPDGTLCQITGRNSQGKSSVLDAIQAALGGSKWTPDDPIRHGQESAKVVLETEEFTVTRRWSLESGDKLSIESKDAGATYRSPQGMLDKLIGGIAFDPLAFTRMKPKEQAELLRKVTGLDTSALDGERRTVFEERTVVNRQLAAAKAKLAGMTEPEPVAVTAKEIDISAFVGQIEEAGKKKAANDKIRSDVQGNEQRLAEKVAQLEKLKTEITDMELYLDNARRVVASLIDPDVTAIKTELDKAKIHNQVVAAATKAKADADRKANEYAVVEQQVADAERIAKSQSDRLDEIDAEKAKLLTTVKFPVPGLGLTEDTVIFNDVPFAQASSSQQIKVGLAIGASLNPGIRTLLVRDGSLLDDVSLAQVAAWAEQADMQVIIERVGDGPTGIVIENGTVKK